MIYDQQPHLQLVRLQLAYHSSPPKDPNGILLHTCTTLWSPSSLSDTFDHWRTVHTHPKKIFKLSITAMIYLNSLHLLLWDRHCLHIWNNQTLCMSNNTLNKAQWYTRYFVCTCIVIYLVSDSKHYNYFIRFFSITKLTLSEHTICKSYGHMTTDKRHVRYTCIGRTYSLSDPLHSVLVHSYLADSNQASYSRWGKLLTLPHTPARKLRNTLSSSSLSKKVKTMQASTYS